MATRQASIVSQLLATYLKALANRFSPTQLTYLTVGKKKPLLVYGSLMLPLQIAHIIGDLESADQIASQMTPATLYHHERRAVKDALFPAVVAAPAEYLWDPLKEVKGLLVFDLTDSQQSDLDRYECGLYNLMPVEVWIEVVDELDARIVVDAEVYVWAGSRDELLEVEEKVWTIEEYLDRRASTALVEGNGKQDVV
ncbi:hypothetical protein MMC18_003962 [Xylographa bjoerkii]|nr:hypothetical protein [Xylographa bjoerkii]